MRKMFTRLPNWQLLSCVIGLIAGSFPGVSFTGEFHGLSYLGGGGLGAPAEDQRVRVISVERGSPAALAGFRPGDVVNSPATTDEVRGALSAVHRGEFRLFTVQRGESEVTVQVARTQPELAAIWYADLWYPIAGALFLGALVLVITTVKVVPAPRWRSALLILAGLGSVVGFVVVLASGSIFTRFRVYQRLPMGVGDEWYFQQGYVGIAAGVLLAGFAAVELYQRISGRQSSNSPAEG